MLDIVRPPDEAVGAIFTGRLRRGFRVINRCDDLLAAVAFAMISPSSSTMFFICRLQSGRPGIGSSDVTLNNGTLNCG
jgi:hypothetical protein